MARWLLDQGVAREDAERIIRNAFNCGLGDFVAAFQKRPFAPNAIKWALSPIGSKGALVWAKCGFELDEATEWAGRGFTPEKARAWRRAGIPPEEASKAAAMGQSPPDGLGVQEPR